MNETHGIIICVSLASSIGNDIPLQPDEVKRMEGALQAHEREKWNQRYLEGTHGKLPPDPFLVDAFDRYVEPLFPNAGHALDIAGGTGRHAIFLASKGWKVRMTDIAEMGIENARKNAGALANRIEFQVEDLTQFHGSRESYDLIAVFFFLQREMFPELVKALKPGGLLLYKGYTREQAKFGGGPTNPDFLFGENELLHSFPELRVLHYAELIRDCGMAEFVGRKANLPGVLP
jgi:SAM-dependent methyltransferase